MDPITLAILAGVGGQAASQIGNLLPSSLDRANKQELEKLKRAQEMGTLGLTEKEQALMLQKLSAGAGASAAQSEAERARLLAGGGMAGGAKALEQAVAQDAARAAQQERISATILEQDLAKEASQKETIAALQAAEAERKAQKRQIFGSLAGAAIESAVTGVADQAVIQGAKSPSPQLIQSVKQTFGFATDDEARGYIELRATDKNAADYYIELMKSRSAPAAAPAATGGK